MLFKFSINSAVWDFKKCLRGLWMVPSYSMIFFQEYGKHVHYFTKNKNCDLNKMLKNGLALKTYQNFIIVLLHLQI